MAHVILYVQKQVEAVDIINYYMQSILIVCTFYIFVYILKQPSNNDFNDILTTSMNNTKILRSMFTSQSVQTLMNN